MEGLGDRVKDAIANKLYPTLRSLEDALYEEVDSVSKEAGGFSSMIHSWMDLQVNASSKI